MLGKTLAIVTAFAAMAALAQPAAAEDRNDRFSLSFEALDLSRPAGAEIAFRRIERAAQIMCGDSLQRPTPLYERMAFRRCVNAVMGDAVASLDAPLVSNLFASGHAVVIATR